MSEHDQDKHRHQGLNHYRHNKKLQPQLASPDTIRNALNRLRRITDTDHGVLRADSGGKKKRLHLEKKPSTL